MKIANQRMLKPDEASERSADLKQAFLRHLPERIGAIEDNWRSLIRDEWNQVKLTRLLQRVQDLAGAAGKYGLIQISERVFSLETYLKQLVAASGMPEPEHAAEVDELLNGLKSVVGASRTPAEELLGSAKSKNRVYFLRGDDSLGSGLEAALEHLDCAVTLFRRPKELLDGFDKNPPSVLLVDAQWLAAVKSLTDRLNNERKSGQPAPPLMVLSNTSGLDVRLHSMRAGAAAFFVPPLDVSQVAARIKQSAKPDDGGGFRIMVVDDDPSQAEFAAAILRKASMETCVVTEPLRVLENMDVFRPDLILMDLYMPDADGIELTSIIREQNEFVSVPIVFLSGEQDADKQLDALSVGGDDFIAKPIRPRHLITTIKNRVQRVRALQTQNDARSSRDGVTGLFSRRHFFERLENALSNRGHNPVSSGVLYAEINEQEEIHQQIGGSRNDTLLAEIGGLIAAGVETQDVAARVGDGSFAVIAKRPLDKQLTQLGEQLINAVANSDFDVEGLKTLPTLSVGLCFFEAAPNDAAGLVNRAAKACQEAKSAGNRGVQVYEGQPAAAAAAPAPDVESMLRTALAEDGFQVLFQPFVNLHDQESESYEMTLRLRGDDDEPLESEQFATVAKRAGLAKNLDRWLAAKALEVMSERRQAGSEVRLLVRQSADTLVDGSTLDWLRGELRRRLLVGTGLILEFNLVDVANHLKPSRQLFAQLQEMGVSVCLARFGHNDASYKLLQYLRAEYVKVVEKLLKADPRIIASLVARIHQSKTQVIVPRVDDPRLIGQHWLSGADFVQGNAIRRPQEEADYDFSERL